MIKKHGFKPDPLVLVIKGKGAAFNIFKRIFHIYIFTDAFSHLEIKEGRTSLCGNTSDFIERELHQCAFGNRYDTWHFPYV